MHDLRRVFIIFSPKVHNFVFTNVEGRVPLFRPMENLVCLFVWPLSRPSWGLFHEFSPAYSPLLVIMLSTWCAGTTDWLFTGRRRVGRRGIFLKSLALRHWKVYRDTPSRLPSSRNKYGLLVNSFYTLMNSTPSPTQRFLNSMLKVKAVLYGIGEASIFGRIPDTVTFSDFYL